MPKFLTLSDLDFKDKTALVRVDLNSPIFTAQFVAKAQQAQGSQAGR